MQAPHFQLEVEDISPVEKSLSFEIPVSHVKQKLELAYRKAAKEAELPGFRKGKAPRNLLERYYKKQVESDVFSDLFEEILNESIEKNQFHIVGQPTLESRSEFTLEKPLTFKIRIETYPQVELKNYEGFSVTERAPKVNPDEIEKELEWKRERLVELKPIEGRDTLGPSDIVTLEAQGYIDSKPYHEKKLSVDLSQPEEASLKGLPEALIGVSIHAKNYPLSFSSSQIVAGKQSIGKAELQISIQSAHQKNLPALDDDFAKDTGEAETLQELREKISSGLLERDARRAKREMQGKLMEELIKQNPVALPPSLVRRVAQDYLKERRYELFMRALEKQPNPEQITPQLLLEIAQSLAAQDLAFQLLARTIAETSQLEVSAAEIEKRLADWAHQEGVSVSRLKSQVEKEDPQFNNLRAQLLTEKVIGLIESRAQIHKESPATS